MRPSPPTRAATILLAEANPQMRSAIRSMLFQQKLNNVKEVYDSRTFIDAVRTVHYPVILLDAGIPNLDPLAITRLIRAGKFGLNSTSGIILLSSRSDLPFVYEAREAGVSELIAKPFSSAVLMARLVNMMRKPRPFVSSESYAGPCRRTGQQKPGFEVPRQRAEDGVREVRTQAAVGMIDDLLILPRHSH